MKTYDYQYTIKLDDMDFQGHVGNANWLILLERARVELIKDLGYPYDELARDELGSVVARANLRYLLPAFYDDVITISIQITEIGDNHLMLKHKCRNQNRKICLTAELKIVFINKAGRPINVPKTIRSHLDEGN
ncbi:acyl-CoA thioesterase [Francisellaceae bacterium]|nr:acyl-CoA thioesterase [Francisellaceae bacterium]